MHGINYMQGSGCWHVDRTVGHQAKKSSEESRSDNKRDPVAYINVALNDAVESNLLVSQLPYDADNFFISSTALFSSRFIKHVLVESRIPVQISYENDFF